MRYPTARLLIAGNYASHFPEYSQQVKAAITNNDKILNIGFTTDVTAFYNGCDIIVNNSNSNRSESLGTSIYEAMACEKIVIASDTGGTPEIITDGKDGFLFKTDSHESLKERLSFVLEHHHELDGIRKAARQKVLSKFNITAMQLHYNNIINATDSL